MDQSSGPHALQARALGCGRVAGIGVAVAIAGQFSGWNYGLSIGGWGGLMAAVGLTALFYLGFLQCVAELSAAMPTAGGFEAYCRRAFGETAGYLAGASVLIALALAIGVVANFFAGYGQAVFGLAGGPLKAVLFAGVLLLQLRGAREATGVTLVVAALAVVTLLAFSAAMAPFAERRHLIAAGQHPLFAHGIGGVIYSIPFALWMFLGVEQAALAAEETDDPARTLPKALAIAVATLLISALGVVVLGTAGAGVQRLASSQDPLYAALTSPSVYGTETPLTKLIGAGVLAGLIATFFSVVYASSRQLYALARDGYLLRRLAAVNRHHAPHAALLCVCAVGLVAGWAPPEQVMLLVVFLLTTTYLLVVASFIQLRYADRQLARPYRAVGGNVTATLSGALSLLILLACLLQQMSGMVYGLALYAFLILQFLVSRRARRAAVEQQHQSEGTNP
jgi:ethanolamine permease